MRQVILAVVAVGGVALGVRFVGTWAERTGLRQQREGIERMNDVCSLLKEGRLSEAALLIPEEWRIPFMSLPSGPASECTVGAAQPANISPGPTDGKMIEHSARILYPDGAKRELRYYFEEAFLVKWPYWRLKWVMTETPQMETRGR